VTAPTEADVVVIGLGAMGSATCFQLAARGLSVIGIDQYQPPHPYGSTHGETRITRLAIGEGPEYAPFVRRSHELWRELEALSEETLLTSCGGLILGAGSSEFLRQTRAVAQRYGIAHEHLGAAEIARRFPMFVSDDPLEAYYEPTAGYVRVETAVKAQLELASRTGATLRLGERVTSWSASNGAVSVRTDAGSYRASELVFCAGPWITELLPELDEEFVVYRQLLHWFPIREGLQQLSEMPVWVWDLGGERQGFTHLNCFYGFPSVDGLSGGVKLATETYEHTTRPDGRQHPASAQESDEIYRRYVEPHLPWLGAPALRSVSCLYTSTRTSRFLIDRHPQHDAVTIVSACSGHGFKHSPAIGEAVAQLITEGSSTLDLAPFSLAGAARQSAE